MVYSDDYIATHDIDWFFRTGDIRVHVASAGGSLPDGFNNKESLLQNAHDAYNLPFIFDENEVEVNEAMLNRLFENQHIADRRSNNSINAAKNAYKRSFVEMARRGLWSFDRTNISDISSPYYHLVAKPRENRQLDFEVTDVEVNLIHDPFNDLFPEELNVIKLVDIINELSHSK